MDYVIYLSLVGQCNNQKDHTGPGRDSGVPTSVGSGIQYVNLVDPTESQGSVCFCEYTPYCKVPESLMEGLQVLFPG